MHLSILDKIKCNEDLKNGMSVRAVAKKYRISIGTASSLKKVGAELTNKISRNESLDKTRLCRLTGNAAILDERIYNWFSAARSHNIPISGPIIQEKAKKVAQILSLHNFKASNGWLEAFRNRHNISFRALHGESANLDQNIVENWKKCFPNIAHGYEPYNIWNLDETGLFWRGLPQKSLILKGEKAKGGKLAKERITICLLCSSTGEKFKPLIIGKSAMPRAFKKAIPINIFWRSNNKAWMTSKFYCEYLHHFNNLMIQQNRKILLMLDNAPCHPTIELSNVKLLFLPPNTTSATQPLDAGIIRIFKLRYRQLLLNYLLTVNEMNEDVLKHMKTITVKHAVAWISSAWMNIQNPIIINCFKHAGVDNQDNTEIFSSDSEECSLLACANLLCLDEPIMINEEIQTYDCIDDGQWEDAILNPRDVDVTEADDDNDEPSLQIIPSMTNAMECLKMLSDYIIYNDLDSAIPPLSELQRIILSKKITVLKTTTIDQYFDKE